MSHTLTERQKEYLNFIRDYIQENESAPRLGEIAEHFGVTSPTAHKTLQTLQVEGQLYSARDRITGFYIRVPEKIGNNAPFFELNCIGKVNRYGEIMDFPEKHRHFPATLIGSAPENVFAVELWQHIPNAYMQAGDLIIFDQAKAPQPGQIGIIPWGKVLILARLFSPIIDETMPYFGLLEDNLPDWKELINGLEGYLFWWPLAHTDKTDEDFAEAAMRINTPWKPILNDHVLAIAIQLDRPLTL